MTKSFPDDAQPRVARVFDIANVGPRRRFVANGRIVSNCNWQNLPSTGDGANIRKAILAPPGTKIVGCDASQVEARMTAWLSGFEEKLDAFSLYDAGRGPDMYCISAEGIYNRPIDKYADPFERFIGKVFELSCQYGAGALRVKHALAQGFRGAPPVFMELHEVKASVDRWRKANSAIINYWSRIENNAINAWVRESEVEDGPLIFEKFKDDGYIHMPNGTFMKYTGVHYDRAQRALVYLSKNGPTKLWGGHLLENCLSADTQVLTPQGPKRIIDVTLDDFLWDGAEWVRHDGLVHKGERETIDFGGVRMTSDHEVLVEGAWYAAGDSSIEAAVGSFSRHHRLPQRRPDGSLFRGVEREERTLECPLRLRDDESGEPRVAQNAIVRPPEPVFDLKNAGSNNRFTVLTPDGAPFIVHNCSQALCCALLKWHMIRIMDEMPEFFLALTVHDELVGLAANEDVERVVARVKAIMSTTPDYMQGLPLNAAAGYGDCYEKAE